MSSETVPVNAPTIAPLTAVLNALLERIYAASMYVEPPEVIRPIALFMPIYFQN